MSGISFTGLGSGMPVSDIVSGLVTAEKTPYINRVNRQGGELTTDISANGALKNALAAMESSLEKLGNVDNFQLRSSSGSDDFMSITSTKEAQIGGYDIKVNNLAQSEKSMTNKFSDDAPMGEGKLNFATATDVANGDIGFSIEVAAEDTLADVRDKINQASDNDDVIATIITETSGEQRLIMTTQETGLQSALTVTATALDGSELESTSPLNEFASEQLTQLRAAADASITIDNAITLTSATDEFVDAIDGITITAKKAHGEDDSPSTATIREDNNLLENQLAEFVNKYNEFQTLATDLGKGGGEDENAGVLVGDSLLRSVTSKVRNMISSTFENNGTTLRLSQLGVESDQHGKMSFDKSVLKEAVSNDPDAIQAFFTGSDEQAGFASTMDTMLKGYTKSNGIIDSRIEGYNKQLSQLDEDMKAFNIKMAKYEERLYSQYNAMDALVANMNATSSYLMGQLDNMPGVVKQSK